MEVTVEPTELALTIALLLFVIVLVVAAYQLVWRKRVKAEKAKSK